MTHSNFSVTSVVRELEAGSTGGSRHILEQVPESLTYSVVTIPAPVDPNAIGWKPKTVNTAYPAGHVNLPYALAVELAQFLNGIEGRVHKGRIAVVVHRTKGSLEKFDVLSVPGQFDPMLGRHVLKGYSLTGVSLSKAVTEANRINTEVLRLATVPKVWAVIVVDGTGEGVQS